MQIDAVAKSRDGKFRIVSNDEREQTLNQLLTVSIPLMLLVFCNSGRRKKKHLTMRLMCYNCIAGDGWV